MANLTVIQADFSFGQQPKWDWKLSNTSGSSITYTNGMLQSITLTGTFNVTTDSQISGTISKLDFFENGSAAFRMDGLSLNAATLVNLLTQVADSRQTFAYLLGGDDLIIGSNGRDVLNGYGGNDSIFGGTGDDVIFSGGSNNHIDGGDGFDTVMYSGKLANYKIERTGIDGVLTAYSITDLKAGTTDRVSSVDMIQFSDKALLPIDAHGASGQLFRLYQAALDRLPDAFGMQYWEGQLQKGASLTSIAFEFIKSQEFHKLYGDSASNADLVGAFYQHILHRPGEQAGIDFWTGVLDKHAATPQQVLAAISDSPENVQLSIGLIGIGVVVDLPVVTI